MQLPNQSSPIMRNVRSVQLSKGLLPQACFDDCMAQKYGIPECKSAYNTREPGEIASCLIKFGFNTFPWAVGFNISECGAKCIFG